MKKILTAAAMALLLLGCAKQVDDHSGILEKLAELDNRVTALESSIASLQSAIGDGIFVQKVEEYVDPDTGKTVGVTVTYTSGKVAHFEIKPKDNYSGPVLGVISNGAGQLVWAVDGIAIQVDGEYVPVYLTPVFSMDDEGNLIVTVDGKETNLGPVSSEGGATLQDGIFTDLAVTDDAVVLTLSDGSTVNIPFAEAFQLNIETTEYEYSTMDPITIPYTVSAKTEGTVVNVSGYNPKAFKVEVDENNIVITPLKLTESAVMLAYADSRVGLISFVNIVIAAEGTDGPKNLSKQGTANSYIVTEAGEYKFKTVQGNTEESVGTVASAEILWETWNNTEEVTPNSLVASVAVDGEYIVFSTPATFHAGNALIAAKDASGTILWSWHIWMPESGIALVSEANYSAKQTMDRNLGALVPAAADAPAPVGSFGLLYEWGRKDPFPGLGVASGTTAATVAGTAITYQDTRMSVEESVQHPTAYVYAKAWTPEETATTADGVLWGETTKTVYDPCPVGYMLPQRAGTDFWKGTQMKDFEGFTYSADNASFTMGSLVFPFAGYLDNSTELHKKAGLRTVLWSGRWDSGTENGYGFYAYLDSDGPYFKRTSVVRSRGGSVRCVSEE